MGSQNGVPTLGDENDPRAYIRLAAQLRKDIQDGKYQPGTRVPSITTLNAQTGHARMTVSKSLAVLVDEGLLIRYPGLGYHVTPNASGTAPSDS